MRVIAGVFKGRRLDTPSGHRTRPTADQVRIALMDTLMPWLPDAHVLDLYAGAGGVGLEALSRGAAHVTFVESDVRALAALRKNVETLRVRPRSRLVRGDVRREVGRLQGARFDIVFLDPPYESDLVAATLVRVGAGDVTVPGSLVVAQHLTKHAPPDRVGCLVAYRARRFGETTLTFFRHVGDDRAEPEASRDTSAR